MVKLTPKLISQEFPDEDPQSMQKLALSGKGIEKVAEFHRVTPVTSHRTSSHRRVCDADCSSKYVLSADQARFEQQPSN